MKIYKYIQFFLIFFVAIYPATIYGQDAYNNKIGELNADIIEEKIILATDRTIYVVDESILFKAVYLTDRNPGNIHWSSVLYVELITSDGTPVVQSKFPLSPGGTSGFIQLPNDLHSGVYYLKAYTKWMRNYPANKYGYYQIKLINPYKQTQLTETSTTDGSRIAGEKETPADNHIEITTDKSKYGTREKVELNLMLTDKTGLYSTYAVSVVKKNAKKLSAISTGGSIQESSYNKSAVYYPEIYGITLSGKVVNPENGQPVSNASMSLSLLNKPSFYSECLTNPNGDFFFTFPFSEKAHDFYLNAEKGEMDLEINIDQDFCSRPVIVGETKFILSAEERALVRELTINTQLINKYKQYLIKGDSVIAQKIPNSFYGSPDKVYFTQDYINLPNMEEFLFELVPEVTVTYQNKIPYLHASKWNVYHNFPFLILVDNIPVSNLRTFLNIKPNTIERLELIDDSYVIGDSKYNGIINAYSRKENIAGIDLPKNSQFFNYEMYAPLENEEFHLIHNSRIPDRRNCLYWNPDPNLSNSKSTSLSFYTSDITGEYDIVVQRISKLDGKVSFTVANLIVE